MADDQDAGEDVIWEVDDEGRYVFIEDGVTFVLATDGFAYPADELGDLEPVRAGDFAGEGLIPDAPARPVSPGDADPDADVDATLVLDAASDTGAPEPTAANRALTTKLREPVLPTEVVADVLLELDGLKSGYGSLPVLHGVTASIRVGETCVLLGLNGAGKTTTALNVCGALKPWGGHIRYAGQEINAWNTRRCVSEGIVMVPEGRRVFPDLTVEKNLQMGAWSQRSDKDWVEQAREQVFEYFPRLRERTSQLAGTLSGGEQQMLAMGRGLMARPRLLIIDEASMGLAPVIVKDVFDIISQINADGVTVLLIEQNVGALDVADLGLVMEQGRMVKELRGEKLRDRTEVSSVLMG